MLCKNSNINNIIHTTQMQYCKQIKKYIILAVVIIQIETQLKNTKYYYLK
jgi:hypothetical protein